MKKIWILLSAVLLFSCAEEQPQEEETPSFIVTFMEGNDVLSALEVKKGELVEELMIDPVWVEDSIYKIYDGWERQDGTVFDFETPINSNIILYPRTYTEDFTRIVTFVTENKELPSEKEEYTRTLQRGQCLQDLSDIEIDLFQHEGNTYIFYDDGWYTEDNQLFDFSTPIENNIVLTKKYLKITTPFFGAEIKLGVDHILYGILYSKLPEPQYEGHEIAFAFIDMYTKEIMYIATPFYQYENDGHNCVYTCSLDYLPESLYAVGICEIINNKKIFYGSSHIYYADEVINHLDDVDDLLGNILYVQKE